MSSYVYPLLALFAATSTALSGSVVFMLGALFGTHCAIYRDRTTFRLAVIAAVAFAAVASAGGVFFGAMSNLPIHKAVGLFFWCMVVCFWCGNLASALMEMAVMWMDPYLVIQHVLAHKHRSAGPRSVDIDQRATV